MAESALQQDIRRAWYLRFNQQIEPVRSKLAELRHKLALPPLSRETLADQPFSREAAELALMTASLLRADGEPERSRELVSAVERRLAEQGLPGFFHLSTQKALNFMLPGDWSRALEFCLTALNQAQDDWERYSALTNSLICMDNLGLPWEGTRAELERLSSQARGHAEYDGAISQVQFLDRLAAFRNGEITHVLKPIPSGPAEMEGTQAHYFQLWVQRLPYAEPAALGSAEKRRAAEEAFFRANPSHFKKSYRVRTLEGILHPDDLMGPKLSEFSLRLYLWTWNWLANPRTFPLDRIMSILRDFDPQAIRDRMGVDDFQMIRNALTWISLFDPGSGPLVERLLLSMAPARSAEAPLLAFERELLCYLRAVRDRRATEAADFLRALKAHPLWRSRELGLARLAEPRSDGARKYPLAALSERLARMIAPPKSARAPALRVELDLGRISARGTERPVVSPPMAAALSLLNSLESVDCAQFAQVCFGLTRYDPTIHAAKIFNLLSRIRTLAPPTLRFSVKDGRVWSRGSWDGVEIDRGSGLSGQVRGHSEWESLTARQLPRKSTEIADRWARPAQALKLLEGKAELTRRELEALTGKSRATANRIIERWIRQGIVVRRGNARNTVYTFVNPGDTHES
jgi:hypothetical protein